MGNDRGKVIKTVVIDTEWYGYVTWYDYDLCVCAWLPFLIDFVDGCGSVQEKGFVYNMFNSVVINILCFLVYSVPSISSSLYIWNLWLPGKPNYIR